MHASAPRDPSSVFGIEFSPLGTAATARLVLDTVPQSADGIGIVVTPNIQHIALMQKDAEFAAAVRAADLCLGDGFPVHLYARARGSGVTERTTGREVVAAILSAPDALRRHRLLVLCDGEQVAGALRDWAGVHDLAGRVLAVVAPCGFLADRGFQDDLIGQMHRFGATIVLLCLGAPSSELFLHCRRSQLPPCWALCIGQSVKIALGIVPEPPAAMVRLNLEWAWRIMLEPKRMLRRYVPAAWGFLGALARDVRS